MVAALLGVAVSWDWGPIAVLNDSPPFPVSLPGLPVLVHLPVMFVAVLICPAVPPDTVFEIGFVQMAGRIDMLRLNYARK